MKPVSRIVCWNCRNGNAQLFNIKDEKGKKTPDYICGQCKKDNYLPPVTNMSQVYFPTEDELKKEAQKTIALEGDVVT